MKIAIVGCGNVGANLVHHVVGIDGIHTCTLHDVEHGFADAAILDLAGYRPEMARRLSVGRPEDLSASDLILLAVAYKPPPNAAAPDLLASAAGLIDQVLGGVTPKRSAILINLLSPVESMSAYAARTTGLPPNQVLGFGGDLDLNRLRYTLPETGVDRRAVHVIGEHGSRIIPVYPGETDYLQIRDRVRQFLGRIDTLSGRKRNLATAPLLAALIGTIIQNSPTVHYIAGFHARFGVHLTWPFLVGGGGVLKPIPLALPRNAREDLERLLPLRRLEEDQVEQLAGRRE